MRNVRGGFLGVLGVVFWTTSLASAQAKVDEQPLGPDGETLGCSVSPHGEHVAVLVAKGSRFVVDIDGVEGPKIEALLSNVMNSPANPGTYWMGLIPVLFSNDGSHSAYSAKVGDEYVVMLDGKELARGPIASGGNTNLPLTFSANGKHLFYMDADASGKNHIVVDGKPGPADSFPSQLVVSNDGEHYAYTGFDGNLGNGTPNWAVVDGRQVNYFGDNLQYSGRNVLVSTMGVDGNTVLLLNGKPEIKAASVTPMWMSPDGAQIALVITPKSGDPSFLTLNGKTVPETQGLTVEDVYFSADGKRFAALCDTKAGSKFMIIDGKKGEEYQSIPHEIVPGENLNHWHWVAGTEEMAWQTMQLPVPGFTADSSKFVYVASQGGRQFLVEEDQESNPFQGSYALMPALSMAGHRIGVIGLAPNGKQHIVIDDKDQEYVPPIVAGGGPARVDYLTFTPDGSRYAYIASNNLCVDGVMMPGWMNGAEYSFSPDNKHVLYMASAGYVHVFLDGKIVDDGAGTITHPFFSPDSQHVFWLKTGNLAAQGTKDSQELYVDGKPTTHFSDNGMSRGMTTFEFTADGAVTFVARTDENLRRFTVTPDSNITALLATAKAPSGK